MGKSFRDFDDFRRLLEAGVILLFLLLSEVLEVGFPEVGDMILQFDHRPIAFCSLLISIKQSHYPIRLDALHIKLHYFCWRLHPRAITPKGMKLLGLLIESLLAEDRNAALYS